MNRFLSLALVTAFLAAPLLAAARSPYIVEFVPLSTMAARAETLARFRADLGTIDRRAGKTAMPSAIRRTYSMTISGVAIELPDDSVAAIRALPYVRAVHEDHRIGLFPQPTATAPAAFIDARARVHASTLPTRGEGMVIAVIDTGIDATHPALGGGIGPGFKVAGGYDFANDDPDPEDVEGHGTHVAGIIAADSDQISGVAPAATLLAYKVIHHNGDGHESSVVAALEKCVDPNGDGDSSDHVDVANLSLGWITAADSITARAVDAATAAGVIVVASAGNDGDTLGTVVAPALAATAIAVANASTDVDTAHNSSRGPTPGTLAFKPDVAAPGTAIVSTFPGGGFATFSGTSMSAPHVAGVAALLKKLHPGWTPADVKSALITAARAMNAQPFVRGAGHVDALAAHQAALFIDTALGFGIAGDKTGTFDATRSLTVTNRSPAVATIAAIGEGTPEGVTVTVTPPAFTLNAGQSREVSVRVTADNTKWAIPPDLLSGGAIRLQGAFGTARVPWGVVRGARVAIAYDGAIAAILAAAPGTLALFQQYDPAAAEMYVEPGARWDVVMIGCDPAGEVADVIAAEQVLVAGDVLLSMHAADATRRFALDGRDRDGRPLADLPRVAGVREHGVALRTSIDGGVADIFNVGHVRELHLSPLSPRLHIAALESYIDLDTRGVYALMHPELTGAGGPLTVAAGDTAHAPLRWPSDDTIQASTDLGYPDAGRLSTVIVGHTQKSIAAGETIDVFTTRDATLGAFATISLRGERASVEKLRGSVDGVVVAPDLTLPVQTHAVQERQVDLGDGPVHPFAFFGTAATRGGIEYRSGFLGPFDEMVRPSAPTLWTLFDEGGAVRASGTLDDPANPLVLPIAPRFRFHASNQTMRVAGRRSTVDLDVVFGSQPTDLTAPTFTSLRIVDATGELANRVTAGTAAMLHVSVADLDYPQFTARGLAPEAMQVMWRAYGTSTWHPLQAIITGNEDGSLATRGHIPAGITYRADLSAATSIAQFVDLRVDLRDLAGNAVVWTQSPAFAVGEVTAPPKRRAAGH